MSTDTGTRWEQNFGIPDEAWTGEADGDGVRHLHLSLRRPKGNGNATGRSEIWLRIATVLLGLLAVGMLVVSLAAQYRYLMAERHQAVPAAIEALGLDVAMTVFSLLALALAWRGLSARIERALVVVCALGSAGMNLAAANGGSPRSIAAFVMPPLLLAITVDRVVAVVRRHVLGDTESSAWAGAGRVALYGLRFVLALPSTASGLRRQVLIMTPLPGTAAVSPAPDVPAVAAAPASASAGTPATDPDPEPQVKTTGRGQATSKTARFLALVEERYGDLASVNPVKVARIAADLAPEVGLNVGAARSALRPRVLAAQAGGAS